MLKRLRFRLAYYTGFVIGFTYANAALIVAAGDMPEAERLLVKWKLMSLLHAVNKFFDTGG